MDKLDIKSTDTILDVGAGLGGPARFVADKYGCKVIGVDLTKKFGMLKMKLKNYFSI